MDLTKTGTRYILVKLSMSNLIHTYISTSSEVGTGRLGHQRKLIGAQYNLSSLPHQGIIYTEDGGNAFMRNDGTHLPEYMVS